MGLPDVTFFGEVSGVSSRALWSDSEDDDDLKDDVVQKWSLESSVDFSLNNLDVIFVSQGNIKADSRLVLVGQTHLKKMSSDDVASTNLPFLSFQAMTQEQRTGWLIVDPKTCVKVGADVVVHHLHSFLVDKLSNSSAVVLVVNTHPDSGDRIKHLSNEHLLKNPSATALKNVLINKLLPPSIISNPVDAVTMELCTVMKVAASVILVPDSCQSNLDPDLLASLPESLKTVMNSLPKVSPMAESNIYT